jgi:predicted lipid-binding transport protein (Tim44 family)
MGDGFQYGDLIFLGLIAVFIGLRLRAMLGKETGLDPREAWKQATREVPPQEKVIQLNDRAAKAQKQEEDNILEKLKSNSPVTDGLKAIKLVDPKFSTTDFVSGAKLAFEWVVSAFSKGDKDKLKLLLSDDRYREFVREIDANAEAGKFQETTLVSVTAADIVEAVMIGTKAQITVQFATEQIHITRDKDKNIISGDASTIENVVDTWTFERDTTARDPNWKITVT